MPSQFCVCIVTNHVNWHRDNLPLERENTGNLKMQFEWVPCLIFVKMRSYNNLFRGEITPLSSSYNISGLVPMCWLLFQCF